MATAGQPRRDAPGVASDLTITDLGTAIVAGWRDFRANPGFGLFFAGVYVAVGLFLAYALLVLGQKAWLAFAIAGFPLVTPFIAVGLYEVSRRREAGLPLPWRAVLGAARARGNDQLPMMGALLFIGFTFWVGLAHGIAAVFIANAGAGSESLAFLSSSTGLAMLAVGGAIGALIAFVFYAITVASLPMLVERDVDLFTAIHTSFRAVRANRMVLGAWAATIAGSLLLAMLPGFLGLFVVLPVLAHATWHLYRRILPG